MRRISFKKFVIHLSLATSLRLSTLADSNFPDQIMLILSLANVEYMIHFQELDINGLLLTVKRDIARLVVLDEGWYFKK